MYTGWEDSCASSVQSGVLRHPPVPPLPLPLVPPPSVPPPLDCLVRLLCRVARPATCEERL